MMTVLLNSSSSAASHSSSVLWGPIISTTAADTDLVVHNSWSNESPLPFSEPVTGGLYETWENQ